MGAKRIDISDFEKLSLLIWKNFLCHFRRKGALFFIIFSPVLCTAVLVIARIVMNIKSVAISRFDGIDLDESWTILLDEIEQRRTVLANNLILFQSNCLVPILTIVWAPNTRVGFQNIMDNVEANLVNVKVQSYGSCEQLRAEFSAYNYLAGVCFAEDAFYEVKSEYLWVIDNLYPSILNFTLVFPSELRRYEDTFIGSSWNTFHKFDIRQSVQERILADNEGGYVGYVREGFMYLQNAISNSFIRILQTPETAEEYPPVVLQRFSFKEQSFDPLLNNLHFPLALTTLLSYFVVICIMTSEIALEKENGNKRMLKLLGVDAWIYNCSWLITEVTLLFLNNFVMMIIFKISFNESKAILTNSWILPILFILFFYNIAIVSFCILISTFLASPIHSNFLMPLIWMGSFLPIIILMNESDTTTVLANIFLCIFTNCTMAMTWNVLIYYETYSHSSSWWSYFNIKMVDEKISISLCFMLFAVQAIVFFSLAIVTDDVNPGIYGKLKMVNPQSKSSRWSAVKRKVLGAKRAIRTFFHTHKESTKPRGELKNLVASMNGVSKIYKNSIVVENVSLNLYENEIAVLIGHNGAGKTTLLHIIAGLIQPTRGKVFVERFDVHSERELAVARIGVSQQTNTLYTYMTLSEQLYFYSRFKGYNKIQAKVAVEKYCKALQLHEYKNTKTKNLQVGIQHMLSICCALSGKNSVVLIDELGSGLDIYHRSLVWDLLISEKQSRTILLSTNSFETLDVLADRIVVLSNGVVKCTGTADYLKSVYSHGYRLVCLKGENCKRKYVSEFLQNFIPKIVPISEIGKKITYIITPNYANRIVPLIDELENHLDSLYLESFLIDGKTAEDIYLSMLAEDADENSELRLHQILNGQCIFPEENVNPTFLMSYQPLRTYMLWLMQLYAMSAKWFIQVTRRKIVVGLQLVIPVLVTVMSVFIADIDVTKLTSVDISYNLQEYEKSIVLLTHSTETGTAGELPYYYTQIIQKINDSNLIVTPETLFENKLLEMQRENSKFANKKILIGASMKDKILIAHFNNYPLHTAPLAMNTIYDALAKLTVDNTGIIVNFKPIPRTITKTYPIKLTRISNNFVVDLAISLVLCLIWSLTIPYLAREKLSKFKMLQYMAGARINTYWLPVIFYDLIIVLLTSTAVFGVLKLCCDQIICNTHILFWYWKAMVLQGLCIISVNYLALHIFSVPGFAYISLAFFHTYCITLYFIIYKLFTDEYKTNNQKSFYVDIVLTVLPGYNFASMLWKIYEVGELQLICSNDVVENLSVFYSKCNVKPNCCLKHDVLNWYTGIQYELYICIITIVLAWMVHLFLEYVTLSRPAFWVRPPPADNYISAYNSHVRRHAEDIFGFNIDDVSAEAVRIQILRTKEVSNKALICSCLGKKFHNQLAIDRLNFMVERYQCFCILGTHDSGKTVLLKMLAGDMQNTFGRIYVKGTLMQSNQLKVRGNIGYCPQNTVVLCELTPREILQMYARLNGVPNKLIKPICSSLAKTLGFFSSYNKLLRLCSEGITRRLRFAVALLGNKAIIYLDDTSAGVDPAGKRQLYNIFSQVLVTGKSILMTTHSSKECEGFSNRLAILMGGSFWSLGSTMELQDKFGVGYMLQLRVDSRKKQKLTKLSNSSRLYLNIITFIESAFPGAVLKAQRSNILYFFLLLKPNKISRIFEVIEPSIPTYNILEFSISRCTLGTIYLEIIEKMKFRKTQH